MAFLLALFLAILAWPNLVPASFFEVPSSKAVPWADAIIYLGGDAQARQQKSLDLLQEGKGRFLLITGEAPYTARKLKALLPPEKRVVEPAATSTWENALFSYPLLHARGAKSAILVTDWWHSRRALACFRRACPGIELTVVPAALPGPERLRGSIANLRREYLARLWYAVRYAIW